MIIPRRSREYNIYKRELYDAKQSEDLDDQIGFLRSSN